MITCHKVIQLQPEGVGSGCSPGESIASRERQARLEPATGGLKHEQVLHFII